MRRLVAALILLSATSCVRTVSQMYPGCHVAGAGYAICNIDDDRKDILPIIEIGIDSWIDVFRVEFGDDTVRKALPYLGVYWGKLPAEHCPCPTGCSVNGCYDAVAGYNGQIWVNTHTKTQATDWHLVDFYDTALHHELVHMFERAADQGIDYSHSKIPHRWSGLLPSLAKAEWKRRVALSGL